MVPTRLFCPWDSSGKDTGVGYQVLLQGIFLIQGLNCCLLCLLYWQGASSPLASPGKPSVSMAIIKKSTNNKCWRGYGEKGILLQCGWECTLIQPLRRPVQRFLAVLCLVAQLCLIFCDPKDCSLPGSSVHGDSPGKNTGVG